MFIKRSLLTAAGFIIAASSFTGCSSADSTSVPAEKSASKVDVMDADIKDDTTGTSSETEPFSVVCTIFPEYDWTKEILGSHAENVEISYLLDNGTDLHNYQPTADDIVKISTCDLFIYVGGESDEWVEDALANATNADMKVINLMDVLGDSAKVEELKEGMQGEEEHSHEHSSEFDESDVKDRSLSEWNGSWQSTYPLLLDGSLDEVWEHKAEDDDTMSAEDYKMLLRHLIAIGHEIS